MSMCSFDDDDDRRKGARHNEEIRAFESLLWSWPNKRKRVRSLERYQLDLDCFGLFFCKSTLSAVVINLLQQSNIIYGCIFLMPNT